VKNNGVKQALLHIAISLISLTAWVIEVPPGQLPETARVSWQWNI
jgi:hypothetical protein